MRRERTCMSNKKVRKAEMQLVYLAFFHLKKSFCYAFLLFKNCAERRETAWIHFSQFHVAWEPLQQQVWMKGGKTEVQTAKNKQGVTRKIQLPTVLHHRIKEGKVKKGQTQGCVPSFSHAPWPGCKKSWLLTLYLWKILVMRITCRHLLTLAIRISFTF